MYVMDGSMTASSCTIHDDDAAGETDAVCAAHTPLSDEQPQEQKLLLVQEQVVRSISYCDDLYGDYTLYRYEQVEQKWSSFFAKAKLEPETLCWVLQSKGKKKQRKKGNNCTSNNDSDNMVHDTSTSTSTTCEKQQRKELLSRAWVVAEEEYNNSNNNNDNRRQSQSQSQLDQPRFLMRYPKGSTYHVKRDNLLVVLQESHLVIVLPETNLYRRWALVHTRSDDSFCEIGCDVGILVHRIWEHSSCPENVSGIDKAPEDIHQAQQRFPHCNFLAWQVPLGEQQQQPSSSSSSSSSGNKDMTMLLPMNLFPKPPNKIDMNPSLVVAIDINGNRELEAVQECIQIVIQEWKPRLILVKSRALYADLALNEGTITRK
jgi:hypothetical protein